MDHNKPKNASEGIAVSYDNINRFHNLKLSVFNMLYAKHLTV